MTSPSSSVKTAYRDLLIALKLRAMTAMGGNAILDDQSGHEGVWYSRTRVAGRVIDRFIGKDTPGLRASIELGQTQRESFAHLERHCVNLIAQLKGHGVPTLDRDSGKLLSALSRVGVFHLGGTLVGSQAFGLYAGELGSCLAIDLVHAEGLSEAPPDALRLVLGHPIEPILTDSFKALRLRPASETSPDNRPTRWIIHGCERRIDFLVPSSADQDEVRWLAPLSVCARAMPLLDFLVEDPIPAAGLFRTGVLIQIPSPERYAIHKLILTARRAGHAPDDAMQDFAEACVLIPALAEDRPQALQAAYMAALSRGREWEAAIQTSLDRRPDMRAIIDML